MYLLSATLLGGLYLLILFGLCFSVVVGIKAVKLELKRKDEPKTTPPERNEKPTKPEQKNEVYYIVEKKRTRKPKQTLSEPKRIEFKK